MADLPTEVSEAVDTEIASLEESMKDPREWFHNHAGQQRIKELYEQQESGTTPSRQPVAGVQRISEIEGMMADTKGEYWHNPELREEYRQLISVDEAGGPEGILDEIGGRLDAALGASLGGVTAAVAGLDETLQVAMARELAQPAGTADPATAEDLAAFAKTLPGDLLLSRSGSDGPQRLGAVMARIDRFEVGLSDADFNNWQDFFHSRLTPQERAAILGEIAT